MPSLTQVARADAYQWYTFYDSLDEIIQDFYRRRTTGEQDAVFITFLFHAQTYLPGLSKSTKNHVLVLLGRILRPFILRKNRISRVTKSLAILHRIQLSPVEANRIFVFVDAYTSQLYNAFITPDQQDQLVWQLTVNFTTYFPDYSLRVSYWMQKIHHMAITCYADRGSSWLRHFLYMWRAIRTHYAGARKEIDDMVLEYMHRVLLKSNDTKAVKETVYIEYVQFLTGGDLTAFASLYTVIRKDQICPFQTTLALPPEGVWITVSSQTRLSDMWQKSMEDTAIEVYHQMETFKATMNITSPLTNETFWVTLFDHQTAYAQYAALWNLRSDNGGLAFVLDGVYMSYVYKEGFLVRNLGHELAHLFFFTWAGSDAHAYVPTWMLEGSAETLGNQSCHGFSFIQQELKTRTPTVPWITSLEYAPSPAVYHWGSLLFRYLYEDHQPPLRRLLLAVIQRRSSRRLFTSEVNRLNHTLFPVFLIKDQQRCYQDYLMQYQRTEDTRYQHYLQTVQPVQQRFLLLSDYLFERSYRNLTTTPIEGFDAFDFSLVNINTRFENNNNTLLHSAVASSDWIAVWWLLMKGSDMEIKNNQEKTPLEMNPHHPELDRMIRAFHQFKEQNPGYRPYQFIPFEPKRARPFVFPSGLENGTESDNTFRSTKPRTTFPVEESLLTTPPRVGLDVTESPFVDPRTEDAIMENVSTLFHRETHTNPTSEWTQIYAWMTETGTACTPPHLTVSPPPDDVTETRLSAGWLALIGPLLFLLMAVVYWRRRPKVLSYSSTKPAASECLRMSFSPVTKLKK